MRLAAGGGETDEGGRLIAIDPAIEAEFENWARWCSYGPWPHPLPADAAGSAEGRYIPESDLGERPPPRPVPPNEQRAMVVQRVYVEELTPRERKVTVERYIRRERPVVIARKLRLTPALVDEAILRAARRVAAAFRMEVV